MTLIKHDIKEQSKILGLEVLSNEINISSPTLRSYLKNKEDRETEEYIEDSFRLYQNHLHDVIPASNLLTKLKRVILEMRCSKGVFNLVVPDSLDLKEMASKITEESGRIIISDNYFDFPEALLHIIDKTNNSTGNISDLNKEVLYKVSKRKAICIVTTNNDISWAEAYYRLPTMNYSDIMAVLYHTFGNKIIPHEELSKMTVEIAGSFKNLQMHIKAIKSCLEYNAKFTTERFHSELRRINDIK